MTVIEVWANTSDTRHAAKWKRLERELLAMGCVLRQEAVGVVIGGKLKMFDIGGRT